MSDKPKPWLTPSEQVEHLRTKGVKFDLMPEMQAENYLRRHNNYFRLRSYRVNFPKFVGGERNGKFINLDFAMLVDLSTIDMCLRDALLPVTLDIEHFSKVALLDAIECNGEDGYQIVQSFFDNDPPGTAPGTSREKILGEISRGASSPYTRGLIESRPDNDWPAWELMEVIPFGRYNHFLRFCADRFGDDALKDDFYLLQSVKGLRNGCAHGSCIINNMGAGNVQYPAKPAVTRALAGIGICRQTRRTKLSNDRFVQIATTLYLHQRIASEGAKERRGAALRALAKRIAENAGYYDQIGPAGSGLEFLQSMIYGWYPAHQ